MGSRGFAGFALLLTVLASIASVTADAPSGNYVDPSDGHLYYYDSSTGSLTDQGDCAQTASAQYCAWNNTTALGEAQNGQCTYVGDWKTGGTYLGLGECASAAADGAFGKVIFRESVTEVSQGSYRKSEYWAWRDYLHNVIQDSLIEDGLGCLPGLGIIAICDHTRSETLTRPSIYAVWLCTRTKILVNDAVSRDTGLVCGAS